MRETWRDVSERWRRERLEEERYEEEAREKRRARQRAQERREEEEREEYVRYQNYLERIREEAYYEYMMEAEQEAADEEEKI